MNFFPFGHLHVVMAQRQFWKMQCMWQQSHLLELGLGSKTLAFLAQRLAGNYFQCLALMLSWLEDNSGKHNAYGNKAIFWSRVQGLELKNSWFRVRVESIGIGGSEIYWRLLT